MHGYFRPFDSGLSGRERMIFNSYYCRLCYCFRIAGTQISRYLTTFDAAIYSIIYSMGAGFSRPPHLHCEKFGKKNLEYFRDDEVGKIFVDISYIAMGEKIRDDKLDGNSFRAWIVEKLYGKEIAESAESNREAQSILKNGFDKLNILQNENRDPMSLFDFYADVSTDMFVAFFKKPVDERYMRLFRAILKWTFFIDMVCDYEDDMKDKSFNSFRDAECPSFSDYFNKHYATVFEINSRISGEIMEALEAIHDDSDEWRILYRVITHSLNNVIQDKLSGKDPRFKIVKETLKNWREYLKKLPDKEGS